jgi:hypothetical protein
MNNYEYNRDKIVTGIQPIVVITVTTLKQKLAIASSDSQFDALISLYLLDAIERVERYTEVYLSVRQFEIYFTQWNGLLSLSGNAIDNLTVKDDGGIDVLFERTSKSQISLTTILPFTVKYQTGLATCDYCFITVIHNIVDIMFYVKEKDEQESKIRIALKPLMRYVKAVRKL